jgi:hypothetical protein
VYELVETDLAESLRSVRGERGIHFGGPTPAGRIAA